MSKDLQNTSLLDLLPDSISRDSNVKASALALDGQLKTIEVALDFPSLYANIDKLTSIQLDHMAYGWNASVWRDYWPIDLKRSVIKNVVTEKRKRGTVQAVKEALSAIQSAATIVEWWQMEPKGTPHTFTVLATLSDFSGVLSTELQQDLVTLIDEAKPARSHYSLVLVRDLKGQMGMTGAIRTTSYARLCAL